MKDLPYWLDIPYTPHSSLESDIEVDVVVIGGGITGVSTAYHCTKAGFKTVLIEKDIIGFGSGGRNGGMVTEGMELDFYQVKEKFSEEIARELWKSTVTAKDLICSLIKENNIDCDFEELGSLYVSLSENENIKLENEARARQKEDFEFRMIEQGKQLKESPFVKTLFNPSDALLHPVKFIRSLTDLAEKDGLLVFEHTPAISFDATSVATPKGIIKAKKVVVALESVNPHLPENIRMSRSQAIVTEPLSDEKVAEMDWKIGGMLWPTDEDYISIRKIGNRLFSCKNLPLNPTQEELEENREWQINKLMSFFPSLKKEDLIISHHWSGLMISNTNYHPRIRNDNGFYEIFGHSGLGLTNGILTGKLIADHFLGADIPNIYGDI